MVKANVPNKTGSSHPPQLPPLSLPTELGTIKLLPYSDKRCLIFQVENLKRANHMWTNDSLFLRDYILIPLSRSPLHHPLHVQQSDAAPAAAASGSGALVVNGSTGSVTPDTDEEIVTRKDVQNSLRLSRSSSFRSMTSEPGTGSLSSSMSMTSSSTSGDLASTSASGKDFLSKFDSTLAQIKNNVQRLETSSK